jgi:hypothetical protein
VIRGTFDVDRYCDKLCMLLGRTGIRQHFVRVHDTVGIQCALDRLHDGNHLGRFGIVQVVGLHDSNAMLGTDTSLLVGWYHAWRNVSERFVVRSSSAPYQSTHKRTAPGHS